MRGIMMGLALTLFAGVAMAQRPGAAAPANKLFNSTSDVSALIAKAKADIKPNAPMISETILELAPYGAHLEYRRAGAGIPPQGAAIHEKEAEFFYVIDGSGVMTTGGKLVNEKRNNAANLSGTAIEGGTETPLKKGDWMVVPQDTPHWVSKINGRIVFMTLHVPRPVPGS